jgi:hypothetical protein
MRWALDNFNDGAAETVFAENNGRLVAVLAWAEFRRFLLSFARMNNR